MMTIKKIAIVLLFVSSVFAVDESEKMSDSQLRSLLKELTTRHKTGWLEKGVIEAQRNSYSKETGETDLTRESLKHDGDKYFYESEILEYYVDRDDAIDKTASVLDLERNRIQNFVWDGKKQTMYLKSGKYAMVSENTSGVVPFNNSLIKAGFIPWGYGAYTFDLLMKSKPRGFWDKYENEDVVKLEFDFASRSQVTIYLDPLRNFVPISREIHYGENHVMRIESKDYKVFDGKWVPQLVLQETFVGDQLHRYDYWDMMYQSLGNDSFDVEYEKGICVEYMPAEVEQRLTFYSTQAVNVDELIAEKVDMIQNKSTKSCAAVAMKYILNKHGIAPLDAQVEKTESCAVMMSLAQLEESFASYNLNTRCVKLDVNSLKQIENQSVVLYLPATKHYVVLADVDDEHVWFVDLSSSKIISMYDKKRFQRMFGDGVVMLVSRGNIVAPDTVKELTHEEKERVLGGSTDCYTCTKVLQEHSVSFCQESQSGVCSGNYFVWFPRLACEKKPTGSSSCSGSMKISCSHCTCIYDPDSTGGCADGAWRHEYIRACL